jgi:hypothetical protein
MSLADVPRIVVCGAGALGGNLIEHLARSAFRAQLVVIDHDRVESANVGNQPYDLRHAGLTKVNALAQRVYDACGREIEGIHATLSAKSAPRLLRDASLVVDALDNAASRLVVRDACANLSIAALHVGVGPGGYLEVRGNKDYRIEAPPGETTPCRDRTTRGQVLVAVALCAEAVRWAVCNELVANRTITLGEIWESSRSP